MSHHYISDVPKRKYFISRPAGHPTRVFAYGATRSRAAAKQMAVDHVLRCIPSKILEKRFTPKVSCFWIAKGKFWQVHAIVKGVQYRKRAASDVAAAKMKREWDRIIAAGKAPYRRAVRS